LKTSFETAISLQTPGLFQQRRLAFSYAGKFMGRFSDQIYLFTLGWYLLSTTHSTIQVGIFLVCWAFPVAISSLLNGIIIERYHRLKLLAAMNLFRCLLALMVAGALYSHALSTLTLDLGTAILAFAGAI